MALVGQVAQRILACLVQLLIIPDSMVHVVLCNLQQRPDSCQRRGEQGRQNGADQPPCHRVAEEGVGRAFGFNHGLEVVNHTDVPLLVAMLSPTLGAQLIQLRQHLQKEIIHLDAYVR